MPRDSDIEYWALERAAKALRKDPASYQSVEGIEYDLTAPSLFNWQIRVDHRLVVDGLVGLFPLGGLIPHEDTTAAAATRPRHAVQIRPVMALVPDPLPSMEATGPTVHFHGSDHHSVTPVIAPDIDVSSAVIADGHHRVAAAQRAGGDPMIMTVLVSVDETGLRAGAFHRVFAGHVELPVGLPGAELLAEPPRDSIAAGRMAIVSRGGAVGIGVRAGSVDDALIGIPAGLANRLVLPAVGLEEAEATYVDSIRRALEAVDGGATAVLLPQARVESVLDAAARGVALPPKSTRFRPKPIKGLLMRPVLA